MPALSPTMEKGNLAKWLKKEGDSVKSGDVIAEIETDKATMEVEAVDEGTLGKILVPEGTNDVAVNTPIAMILGEGEDAASLKGNGGAPKQPPQTRTAGTAAEGRGIGAARRKARAGEESEAPAPAKTGTAKPPSAELMPEPEVPEGTELVTMTMREALARRHGRGNAPRRRRLRHGRGGRRISGRLQSHAGPVGRIRRPARHRHADHRARLCRRRHRRRACRVKADRRIHDLQLRHAGDGSAHQFGGEDAVHVGRPGEALDRVSRSERRRRRGSPRSTARIIRPGIRTFPA